MICIEIVTVSAPVRFRKHLVVVIQCKRLIQNFIEGDLHDFVTFQSALKQSQKILFIQISELRHRQIDHIIARPYHQHRFIRSIGEFTEYIILRKNIFPVIFIRHIPRSGHKIHDVRKIIHKPRERSVLRLRTGQNRRVIIAQFSQGNMVIIICRLAQPHPGAYRRGPDPKIRKQIPRQRNAVSVCDRIVIILRHCVDIFEIIYFLPRYVGNIVRTQIVRGRHPLRQLRQKRIYVDLIFDLLSDIQFRSAAHKTRHRLRQIERRLIDLDRIIRQHILFRLADIIIEPVRKRQH